MLFKVILLIFLWVFSLWGYASPLSQPSQNCVMLGSSPSLIVKFKKIHSQKQPLLSKSVFAGLVSQHAEFTSSAAMSGGAYIINFTPSRSMFSEQIQPGCYAEDMIDELINDLKSREEIEYVDSNILMDVSDVQKSDSRTLVPVIPSVQWNMRTPPGGIDAQDAFNISLGSANAITAVLDTGILNNTSLNPNVLTGVTFYANGSRKVGATPSCTSACPTYNHGTQVAGIVAASGTFAYSQNIYGVAPLSKVLPINVFTQYTDSTNCNGTPPCLKSKSSDVIDALNWLGGESFKHLPAAPLVVMVNMSVAGNGKCGSSMQAALQKVHNHGIGITVGAGDNNGNANQSNPGNCKYTISVAATDKSGFGAPYSNFGDIVSFAAPGGDTTVTSSDGVYSTVEGGYAFMQGTSMASPHAAGLGALLYSIDPTLTPSTLLDILQTTTTAFPSGGPGHSCTSGKPCGTGIINANLAAIATQQQAPVITWTPNISSGINTSTKVTLRWKAASWNPSRKNKIFYTVELDGQPVSDCERILETSCVLKGLTPDASYSVAIDATDARQIYTPLSEPYSLHVTVTAPTLTLANRNSSKYRQVFLHYSDLGAPAADSYEVNGAPSGVTVKLDKENKKFILNNVPTINQISNVSITSVFGSVLKQSNAVTIPAVTVKLPVLTIAARNPLLLTSAFIYYSNLGGPSPDHFAVNGIPNGASISLDSDKNRFIIENINTPEKIDGVTISAVYGSDVFQSNSISIPGIL